MLNKLLFIFVISWARGIPVKDIPQWSLSNWFSPKGEDEIEILQVLPDKITEENIDDALPVDKLMDEVTNEARGLDKKEQEKIENSLEKLRKTMDVERSRYIKVLWNHVRYAIDLGIYGSAERTRSMSKLNDVIEMIDEWIESIVDKLFELIFGKVRYYHEIKNQEEFVDKVLKNPGAVLVKFYFDSCKPCQELAPVLQHIINRKRGKITMVGVNADNHTGIPEKFQVVSYPTVMLFAKGQMIDLIKGVETRPRYEKAVKNAIEESHK